MAEWRPVDSDDKLWFTINSGKKEERSSKRIDSCMLVFVNACAESFIKHMGFHNY